MKDPYNIEKTLTELTKEDIDQLINPSMTGEYLNGISIILKTEKVLKYNIPVIITLSNGKYVIDDGFMIEVVPVDEVKDYWVLP